MKNVKDQDKKPRVFHISIESFFGYANSNSTQRSGTVYNEIDPMTHSKEIRANNNLNRQVKTTYNG